jgi:hypothetical protein
MTSPVKLLLNDSRQHVPFEGTAFSPMSEAGPGFFRPNDAVQTQDMQSRQYVVTSVSESFTTEEQFAGLAETWREQTDGLSLARKKADHPCYQTIIRMGYPVVPCVLRELRDHGGHWYSALSTLTGENPISKEHAGDVRKMRESWLRWGRDKGLIE